MKQNNVIELKNYMELPAYTAPEPFDYAAYNRRAQQRNRRQRILCCVENIVTAAIGFCTVFSVFLVITML